MREATSLRMTAHIAESRDETLFVRDGEGPFADGHREAWHRGDAARVQSDRVSGSSGAAGPGHAADSCNRNG